MTSDGISKKEWGIIKSLSTKVANAVCSGDDVKATKYTKGLLAELDNLEQKYGELPSILATRADYITDVSESLSLLKKAYNLAEKHDDRANLTFIASSIAEAYIDDLGDIKNGRYWLTTLSACLKKYYDEYEFKVYKKLLKKIEPKAKENV